jgi:hypothetical protein
VKLYGGQVLRWFFPFVFSIYHNLGLLDTDIQVVFLHNFFHAVKHPCKIFLLSAIIAMPSPKRSILISSPCTRTLVFHFSFASFMAFSLYTLYRTSYIEIIIKQFNKVRPESIDPVKSYAGRSMPGLGNIFSWAIRTVKTSFYIPRNN